MRRQPVKKKTRYEFSKMQGIGNDYVYINVHQQKVSDPAALARLVSDHWEQYGKPARIGMQTGVLDRKPRPGAYCDKQLNVSFIQWYLGAGGNTHHAHEIFT